MTLESRQGNQEIDPRSIIDTPIPGQVYPRVPFSKLGEGARMLNLKFQAMSDQQGDACVIDPATGTQYWFNQEGRLKKKRLSNLTDFNYVYDEYGRVCVFLKEVCERGHWRELIANQYVYDSPESKMYIVKPLRFDDGLF